MTILYSFHPLPDALTSLIQVAKFMNYMAFEAKLDSIKGNATENGKIYHAGAEFDPMRRKMAVPLE